MSAPIEPPITENASANGTMQDSNSNTAAATGSSPALTPEIQIPRLPLELVLQVAKRTPLATRLELAFTCRENFFLIIPYAANEILARRSLSWDKAAFGSEEKVAAFAQDSLGAQKFRLVNEISCHRVGSREMVWLFNSGVLGRCSALRFLSFDIESSDALKLLSTCCLPNLSSLTIYVCLSQAQLAAAGEPSISFPSLEILNIEGEIPAKVLTSIGKGCAKLRSTTWHLWYYGTDYQNELKDLDDSFLQTVKSVELESGNALLGIAGRPSFQPENIVEEDGLDEFTWPTGQHGLLVWTGLLQMHSLKRFEVSNVPSNNLLLGLPRNLESLDLSNVKVSNLAFDVSPQLRKTFRESKAKVSIDIDDYMPEDLVTPEELRAFAGEISLWANLEVDGISIGGRSTSSAKLEFARAVAEDVEEMIREMNL